ncbi:hypothetical protein T4B_12254 [Trichinella pseudospiralis]|uniref:Uncharacterized protein n=1 Tax=Trichinella pseudospiralis TaxID=6337 RepID=A0A0V1K6K9_TRIPS|nr:hypothetical protein T4A_5638 [Trichinella pseudospiralis]KRZ10359.1 hypothetical protein T4B_12254 [Trichinella pseudospiralis]KRZ42859.1 hypothetical protein T4C_2247 [Trichinella pseudospiralis]
MENPDDCILYADFSDYCATSLQYCSELLILFHADATVDELISSVAALCIYIKFSSSVKI